jgi:hypothetical protein
VYLRDLQVNLSRIAKLPEGYSARAFHDSTHAVVERYLDLLPRRKVKLGGASKVNVQIGPRPSYERQFVLLPDGVAFIWMERFDLERYARVDRAEQQRILLDALHGGLLDIVDRTGSDPLPFERARDGLLTRSFPLPEIPEKELLRRWGLLRGRRRRSQRRRRTT